MPLLRAVPDIPYPAGTGPLAEGLAQRQLRYRSEGQTGRAGTEPELLEVVQMDADPPRTVNDKPVDGTEATVGYTQCCIQGVGGCGTAYTRHRQNANGGVQP